MQNLAEYLASEQAREDVKALLDGREEFVGPDGICLITGPEGQWRAVNALDDAGELLARAYYRPDGDRYVVTDLGEGVRALRLRTGYSQYLAMECSDPMREALRTSGIGNVWSTERGMMELDNITAIDLPGAICRIMLASLRVMEAAL